jgi:hypothetical protein
MGTTLPNLEETAENYLIHTWRFSKPFFTHNPPFYTAYKFRSGPDTYRELLTPALDVLPLGLGKVIPNLLLTCRAEQRINLADWREKAEK